MDHQAEKTTALIAAGQLFHARGWVPASGGNFSYRLDESHIAITASGTHKGELTPQDLMTVDLQGTALEPGRRSSAETGLHTQLYRRFPQTGAVFHTHSVASTCLSRQQDEIVLSQYELLKILEGIDTHDTTVRIPVFDNDQDITRLAALVDQTMDQGRGLQGYLIRGHGLYAWGPNLAVARYRVEALEFLFECEHQAGGRAR